jgi:hypothetical protein
VQYLVEIPVRDAKAVPPRWVKVQSYVVVPRAIGVADHTQDEARCPLPHARRSSHVGHASAGRRLH